MSKPNSNGHDPAEVHVENPGSVRMRKSRERKKAGAVVIRNLEIGPAAISALIASGWMHETETRDAKAVEHALSALLMRVLQAGVTNSGKPLLEIDLEAIEDAWIWAPPGSQLTAQNAAKALQAVSRCCAVVNFGPAAYASHLMRLMAEREAMGTLTH